MKIEIILNQEQVVNLKMVKMNQFQLLVDLKKDIKVMIHQSNHIIIIIIKMI